MPELSVLLVFIPTFFLISLSPGLCMSLALTLGISIGLRKTMWMMLGEIVGVCLVALCAIFGVSKILQDFPTAFTLFKWLGGMYLCYLGVKLSLTEFKVSYLKTNSLGTKSAIRFKLVSQGFITAVLNPKGWAFMVALLPPFINFDKPIGIQITVLLIIIMTSEFICMTIYASGGKSLKLLIDKNQKAHWINKISGLLLVGVGLTLIIS